MKEAMEDRCDRKVATDRFVKTFSSGLCKMLDAGAVVDTVLEDELLGLTKPELISTQTGAMTGSLGYDGGATPSGDDDDDSSTMSSEMQMMMMRKIQGGRRARGLTKRRAGQTNSAWDA